MQFENPIEMAIATTIFNNLFLIKGTFDSYSFGFSDYAPFGWLLVSMPIKMLIKLANVGLEKSNCGKEVQLSGYFRLSIIKQKIFDNILNYIAIHISY